jgi:hypothetical protein
MKKPKKFKYARLSNLKGNQHKLDAMGEEGWRLAGVDDGDGIFVLEEATAYEYKVVRPDMRPRRGEELQETLDTMQADGWRLVSTLQGPRAFDAALVFEREL